MSEGIKMPSKDERARMAMLSAFVGEMFGAELAKRNLLADVRRSSHTDGYELHLAFHYHGVVTCEPSMDLERFAERVAAMILAMRNGINGHIE